MRTHINTPSQGALGGAVYRTIWRWHFYAGIVLAPFILMLAITGAVYLFKPQYENWRYQKLFFVSGNKAPISPDAQLAAAKQAHPEANLKSVTLAQEPGRSTEVVFGNGGAFGDATAFSVFVEPSSGKILGERRDHGGFMGSVSGLHGALLLGTPGKLVMEMVGSWVFVMVATGLYLHWPRPRFKVRGFLVPRLNQGRQVLVRDLHSVTAVWTSAYLLVLLASGMPWTIYNGKWLSVASEKLGQGQPAETSASAVKSDMLGGWSPFLKDAALKLKVENLRSAPGAGAPKPISLSDVMLIAGSLNLQSAYTVSFPRGETGVYSIITERNKPFVRAFVHLDQYSGQVLADVRYKDFGMLAKPQSVGIILHEGQLWGPLNQVLGLVTCLGVIAVTLTGLKLWWSRRPSRTGLLAAPPPPSRKMLPRPVVVGTVVSGVLLPTLGVTLLAFLLIDRVLTPRLKALQI